MAETFWSSIFWIHGHPPPPLAVVLCPRGGRWLRNELRAYHRGRIQTLVSLLEEDEAAMYGLEDEPLLARKLGMQFLSHPIPDHHVPLNTDSFRAFVVEIAERLESGERIGVHCLGSVGRATVTSVCALIHLGWEAEAALAAVKIARGCTVPDTEEQRRWILRYEAHP
jgi:protein-tyrosine phosphatase